LNLIQKFTFLGLPSKNVFSIEFKLKTKNMLASSVEDACIYSNAALSPFRIEQIKKKIPSTVLGSVQGVAVATILRAGVGCGLIAGSGVVFSRMEESGIWSAPSAFSVWGCSIGPHASFTLGHAVILLQSRQAVDSFASNFQFSLSACAGILVATEGLMKSIPLFDKSSAVSYSGNYAGFSLETALLCADNRLNNRAYGRNVSAGVILRGDVEIPEYAKPLISAIKKLTRPDMIAREYMAPPMLRAIALYSFKPREKDDLALQVGDVIQDVRLSQEWGEWSWGVIGTREGYFPRTYCKLLARMED
jgi:lipid-binding SYLF domain-containing protein